VNAVNADKNASAGQLLRVGFITAAGAGLFWLGVAVGGALLFPDAKRVMTPLKPAPCGCGGNCGGSAK
jgi:hypothetical protein